MEPQQQSSESFQRFDDLVDVDAYGRGHRPDGKFLSNYEIEQIGANQELIREFDSSAYVGRHRKEEGVEAPFIAPSETLPGDTLADVIPVLEAVPAEPGAFRSFLSGRFQALKSQWRTVKETAGEARADRRQRQLEANESSLRLKDLNLSRREWVAYTAYEVLTLNQLRTIGVLALYGAMGPMREVTGADKRTQTIRGYLNEATAPPLEGTLRRAMAGTNNPVLRKAMARQNDATVDAHLKKYGIKGVSRATPVVETNPSGEAAIRYEHTTVPFDRDTLRSRRANRAAWKAARSAVEQSKKAA